MGTRLVLCLLLFFLIFSIGKLQANESVSEDENTEEKRLFGGKDAKVGEHPYIVSVGKYTDPEKKFSKRFCGGAILKEDWILTAAHCLKDIKVDEIFFKAGVAYAAGDRETMQLVEAEKFFIHPKFKDPQFYYWDIALVKTKQKFKFNKNVQPIQLPEPDSEPSDPSIVIMGYGAVDPKHKVEFSTLKSAVTRLTPKNECYKATFQFHERLLCINHMNVPKDSGLCPGDSGSPAVQERNGVKVVVGINSFIHGDCGQGVSAFTHVSKYVSNFINPVLNGKEPIV